MCGSSDKLYLKACTLMFVQEPYCQLRNFQCGCEIQYNINNMTRRYYVNFASTPHPRNSKFYKRYKVNIKRK